LELKLRALGLEIALGSWRRHSGPVCRSPPCTRLREDENLLMSMAEAHQEAGPAHGKRSQESSFRRCLASSAGGKRVSGFQWLGQRISNVCSYDATNQCVLRVGLQQYMPEKCPSYQTPRRRARYESHDSGNLAAHFSQAAANVLPLLDGPMMPARSKAFRITKYRDDEVAFR
jgi:hypothetical protein